MLVLLEIGIGAPVVAGKVRLSRVNTVTLLHRFGLRVRKHVLCHPHQQHDYVSVKFMVLEE